MLKSKQFLITLVLVGSLLPNMALASWYNPFSWGVFSWFKETIHRDVSPNPPLSTEFPLTDEVKTETKEDQALEIEKLKKEVEELKKKPTPATVPVVSASKQVVPTPKSSVPPTVSDTNNNQPKLESTNSQPVAIETWAQQEVRDFAYADAREWASLTSTNSLGEKRYYRKEGNQWVRKNSENEATTKYTDPNYIWRVLMDDINKALEGSNQRQQQTVNDQKRKQLECLAAPMPAGLETLSPQQQRHVREQTCGTATPTSDLNYKLYQQQEYIECIAEYTQKSIGLQPGDVSYPVYGGDPAQHCDYLKPYFQ